MQCVLRHLHILNPAMLFNFDHIRSLILQTTNMKEYWSFMALVIAFNKLSFFKL